MERLKERLEIAGDALKTLDEVLRQPKTAIVRDASIQRFEYTLEAVWKAAQRYLKVAESLDLASPKSVIRSCRQAGLLDDPQTRAALQMADDRNLTVHTYNESLAEQIYARILRYAPVLRAWLDAMASRL